jgi:hypothetical protein
MDELSYLIEKSRICDLLNRYAYYVDRNQFDKMVDIFTEDAIFRLVGMDAGEHHMSVKEYCSFVSQIVECCDFVIHNVNNILVEINQETAMATSYLSTVYGVRAGQAIPQFRVHSQKPVDVSHGAEYRDKLIKTPGGWRIEERVCTVFYERESVVQRVASDPSP